MDESEIEELFYYREDDGPSPWYLEATTKKLRRDQNNYED